jgi:hypothetical protein
MPHRQLRLFLAATMATWLVLLPAAAAHADDPARYKTYYSIFTRGEQEIPYLGTTPYVPQGLAYWPEKDAMVVSYLDDRGGKARIVILDRKTSRNSKILIVNDTGHVGALAMSRNYLWVASTTGNAKKVIRYLKSTLANSPDGSQVTQNKDYTLQASSFMEIFGNKLYVGTFEADRSGTAYRYSLDANEDPHYDGGSFNVPPQVQGMAITPTHFIWSRSYGRNNDSQIAVDPRNGSIIRSVTAPNMSEDLATANSEVYVVYESGAMKYSNADYKVRTIHHGQLSKLIP